MRVLIKNVKAFLLTVIFVILIVGIQNVLSVTQLTFNLDLDNPIFRYYENTLNDSSSSNIIFNMSQNVTLYLTIPRNSTILFSNMTLTGKITPSQTYAAGYMSYSVAIGNVTTQENEIVVGKYNSIILLNSSLKEKWNFNTGSGQTYRVAIGDVTSQSGSEIAAACQYSPYVYLLNSTGNQIWTYSDRGEAKGIAIGDITSDTGKEVIVGAGIYVDILNSSKELKWSYTTSGTVYSVAVGNVTSDSGNEIAVGDTSRVYLLNSTGNQIWNFTIGKAVYGLATGDLNEDSGNEIVAGVDNGTVYVLNSTGSVKWTYNIGDMVFDVATGDATSDARDEIAVGSRDKNVYVLNSTGSFVWSYTTGDEVHGVAIGNVTTDPLNETITVSIDNYVYILNFEYYPTNSYLDIGSDGDIEWSYPGKLRISSSIDNSSITPEIQEYLNNVCSSVSCNVPFVFHSDAAGDLNISSINITYDYNASHAISYQLLVSTWSRTNNTHANETIGYEVKNISYGTLGNNVQVNYIKINDSATTCDYAGTHYTNATIEGKNYCDVDNFSISNGTSSFLWDSSMTSSIAIYMNESEPVIESTYWRKNITIWNVTDTIFYSIIANTSLNDTVVDSNETFRVYWNDTWCDLTPTSADSNCDSTNPSYTQKPCDSDIFYVCMKDTDNDGVKDYFKWKQPHSSITVYELSGSTNHMSNLTDANVTPSTGIWGSQFNFTVNVSDAEGNNVTVNLWVYLSSLDTWVMLGSKNTTQDTTTPETILFTVDSNKSWAGVNKYRFEYRDFNDTGFYYHGWQFTQNYTGPNVTKHNVSILYESGDGVSVNRTGSGVLFLVRVNDTDNATIVEEGVNCTFWVTTNGVNFDSGYHTQTNSSGYCNYTFIPNSSYNPGIQTWKAGVHSDSYYLDSNSSDFTITIYGQLNINLTQSIVGRNVTRGQNINLEAKIYDEFNNTIAQSGYNCTWYVNETLLGNSTTNATGYCNYTWSTDCSDVLGFYPINVTLWNSTFSYYIINKNESSTVTALKDTLNITIINPLNSSIIHEGGTVELNSTLSDSCGIPTESYDVNWYFLKSGQCPEANPVATGPNTTWKLNATCTPRQQIIIANATGELYNSGKYNVTIYIYGWADVEIIIPNSSETINRSQLATQEGFTYYNIVCKVGNNITSQTPEKYPVKFWYHEPTVGEHLIGENLTNSVGNATYRWNITSNVTVPESDSYTVKCNITDNSTLYYNASIAQSTASNVRILGGSDVYPPQFIWIHANSVQLYNNVTIEANLTDVYGIDKVWMNITNSSWSEIFFLHNTSTSTTRGVWNISLNLTLGDYDFVIYANDTSGNINSYTNWFEVYLPVLFYGNTTDAYDSNISVSFTFYRNGTNYIIHNFSTTTSNAEYNVTVHNRTYDIEAKVYNHTVKFISVDINENTNNSVRFDIIPYQVIPNIVGVRNKLVGLVIETTLNYATANLTLNFTDAYKQYPSRFFANDVDIYKCSDWNFTPERECSGTWTNIGGTPIPVGNPHAVIINLTSLSAFVAGDTADPNDGYCDPGETCDYDPACCGGTGTTVPVTGGGGGGGGTGISPTCGNGECEAGENSENCPEDCGIPESIFSVRTNLTNVQLDPGQKQNYALWVTNNAKYKMNVSISVVGSISDFIMFEKTQLDIEPQVEQIDKIYVTIPDNAEAGTYTGTIYVTGEGRTQSIPVLITVSLKGAVSLEVYVESLNKLVGLNETAKFRIIVNKYGLGKVDTDFRYVIKEFDTEKEIYEEKERKTIERFQQFVKNIPMSSIDIKPGHYLFEVELTYYGTTVSATDDFQVVTTFLTSARIFQVSLIISIATTIVTVLYARKRYIAWKVSKARYIFPVDMRKLPKGHLWIGKIAETNEKAYYNMNDLTTHILTAGATGSGKSVSAMVFVEELLEQKIPVVVFDPTAQWTGFVRPCRDENLLKYYKEFGLSIRDTKPYTGMIYEVTDPNVKIDFKKYMNPGEITIFSLNKLRPGQYDEAVTNIIDTIFTQGWEESTKLRLVLVFDEVHRLLEKYGGKGGYVALERACREFRKWGIGLIMASQVLSDFKEAIKGNVLTEIQLHTKSLGDLTRIEKKYGLEYAKKVTREEVGVGMMQNPKYNEGRPWFVAFRPTLHSPHKIPDVEMNMYREYAALLADIESKIETMEKAGKDVFDLKMELKLAKDKLKKGRFRMAKIYIDSLTKHLSEG